jgi:hypothetical protein
MRHKKRAWGGIGYADKRSPTVQSSPERIGSNQLELGESDGFCLAADDSFFGRSNDLWRLVLATGLP